MPFILLTKQLKSEIKSSLFSNDIIEDSLHRSPGVDCFKLDSMKTPIR